MDKSPRPHLLVIRFSAMGDVAMTVPVILALNRRYPGLDLTVLTRPSLIPIFGSLPGIRLHAADLEGTHSGIHGLWKLYRELDIGGFTAVADLHNVLRTAILSLFFTWGGIPVMRIDKGRAEKKALTSHNDKVFKPLKPTHERYAEVFEKLGYPVSLTADCILSKQQVSKKTLMLVGREARKWIGIAPFAAYEGKTYPRRLLEKVIDRLNSIGKYRLLLFGGGDRETGMLEDMASRYENVVCMAGKLPLKEELALISNLDLMLSMDSSNGHLAALYGIPILTLWGVTHPYAGFGPFGDQTYALLADRERFPKIPTSVYGNKMPSGYEKAMETITPEAVLSKIESILTA